MNSKILITGGTGLVGSKMSELLTARGYEVTHLSRKEDLNARFPAYQWNVDEGKVDPRALEVDHIIHLAGAAVADKKWSPARKKVLYDSRVKSTRLLFDQVKDSGHPLKSFISASAIGFYGMDTGDELVTEDTPEGKDFLATLTTDWETAAEGFKDLNVNTALLRIGVVLDPGGGALQKMAQPIKWGVGAHFGSGNQYVSWIHMDDICSIFIWMLENGKTGIYNGVAPQAETNKDLTRAIARQLKRPLFMPAVPTFFLKALLGEMSSIVLGGNRVSAQKLLDEGFKFHFPDITSALSDLYR